MSKLDTRLTKLLPEMTVKDKAKLFLQLKNSVDVAEEARLFQHDPLMEDYSRLYESIQGKDIPLVQRQQKEFKFLTNLIWEAESWLRDNLRETRLILLGLVTAAEAISFQRRVNFILRHALNFLREGECVFGFIKRPITREQLAKIKAEEEQTILPLNDLLDAMMESWCEEQSIPSAPYPPLDDWDQFKDEAKWDEHCQAWRNEGYAAFKEHFASEEDYRKWVAEEDYTHDWVVPDASYEAKRSEFEQQLRRLIADGVLVTDTDQEGITTKSWFDHLRANGLTSDSYFFGKYLHEDRYYLASQEDVAQWEKAAGDLADLLARLSSEQKPKEDDGTAVFCGGQFRDFLEQTVEQVNDQLYTSALRQTILERLAAKHFDGLSLVPPYLKEDWDALEHLLRIVTEMLTEELTSPFLKDHKVAPPSPRSLQEFEVAKMVRSIEEGALIDMLRWAGDRQAVFRLLDARRQEALEGYNRNKAHPSTDDRQHPQSTVPSADQPPAHPLEAAQPA